VRARKAYQPNPSGRQSKLRDNNSQRRSTRYNRGKIILVGLGLTAVSLASAAVGAILAVSFSTASPLQQAQLTSEEKKVFSQETTVSTKGLNIPEVSRPVNILVLGIKVLTSDLKDNSASERQKRAGYLELVNSFEGLSDTMLLLRFDPDKETLSVLSIPRDTRVHLNGYGVRKINHANEYGGPALTTAALSDLLGGIKIHRYVRVNVQGIEKLVDALGGVTVDVPKDMKYNDFSQHFYIDLKKGRQHLDGNKAVQFLRFRYDELGDISRVQRQQMLMRSVVEQTLQPATIVKIPKILSVIQSHIDTNLTIQELMGLANFAASTERSDVKMMMLPGDFNNDGRTAVSYWLPNEDRIAKLMHQHFNMPIPEDNYQLSNEGYYSVAQEESARASGLSIAVQDSTGDPAALQSALDALRAAGYRQVFASKNWQQPLVKTKIVAQSGDEEAGALARVTLGVGEVLVESTGVVGSDLTIQLGKDWQRKLQAIQTKTENNPNDSQSLER
jgi:polyisoprenyl-teichoic acid--peptidoglycan teichoic acid transferase